MVFEYVLDNLVPLVGEIFIRPWLHIDTLWMILPLILILILINLYFGRYRTAKLGWGSAFSNSISLLWVCIILGRLLIERHGLEVLYSTFLTSHLVMKDVILVGILTVWVLVLLYLNYFHIIPRRFAFIISSFDAVYILAYVIISLVIGNFVINVHTVIAAVILFILMFLALQAIKLVTPMSRSALRAVKKKAKKEKRKKAAKKAARTRKARGFIDDIKDLFAR